MKNFFEHNIQMAIEYHIEKGIPFSENVFRPHSKTNYALFREASTMLKEGNYTPNDELEEELLMTDIGNFGIYEGKEVPLDFPLSEAEYKGRDVDLDTPKRGGSRKFYVYTKNPDTGKVIKVEFGAKDGGQDLAIKIDDPKARKNFAARHNCKDKKDKTKAGYWSCRLPYYAKSLGLSTGGNFFW